MKQIDSDKLQHRRMLLMTIMKLHSLRKLQFGLLALWGSLFISEYVCLSLSLLFSVSLKKNPTSLLKFR